jgi:hypothetical protein
MQEGRRETDPLPENLHEAQSGVSRGPVVKPVPDRPRLALRFGTGSMHSTLRANPFPEVTDLFCRLPLPTLFYRLEAVHLGDLMRL